MQNPLPPGFALSRRLNMSGVQKGKDGKTPSEKSEDPKWEGKGARPKEFKNLEEKRKRKEKVPSVHVKGQREARITESKSDNFTPQVLRRPREQFESSKDLKHTVVHPDSKPVHEKVGLKSKKRVYFAESLTKGRAEKTSKLRIHPEETRRNIKDISPRKLWTDPDRPVDEEVSPKSKKGAYFAESREMDMTQAKGKETKPDGVPISTFPKLTKDLEETRRKTKDISPRKLFTDPESKPVDEKIGPKFKKGVYFAESLEKDMAEASGKETTPQVPIFNFSKLTKNLEERLRKKEDISPRKLSTDPESKPVDEKVDPISKKGVYFAESLEKDMIEASGKETKPQAPISTFSKITLDPEETRRKTNDISPGKLWKDPDLKLSKRKEKSRESHLSEPVPLLVIDPEETRTKTDVISPRKLWKDPDSTQYKRK